MADNEKEITIDQVALNNGQDGNKLWIVINNKVYDVTDFKHPGGKEVLEDEHGEDRWEEFKSIHSKAAKEQMNEFQIGVLKGTPKDVAKSEGQTESNSLYTVIPFVVLIIAYMIVFRMDAFGIFNKQ